MTTNEKTLSLTLHNHSSVLHGLTRFEVIPKQRIKALLKSNFLQIFWEATDNPYKKQTMQNWANEKLQISAYMMEKEKYIDELSARSVKYAKPKHQWGRAFPSKSLGLTCFRRIIRNTFIHGLYYDFDIKNAQPEIIRNLCESNHIQCPMIQQYCKERSKLKKEVSDYYNVSEDVAKGLFIRLCFFGTFEGWCIENKITNLPPLQFITMFERELKDIANVFKTANLVLYETARKLKDDFFGENLENKVLGSFFALVNQENESRIVENILCHLINNTDLMKINGTKTPAGAYEYDGIKLLKANVDAYEGGVDAVVKLLNEKTLELTGFHLEWTSKPIEEIYDLTKWIALVEEEEKPNNELVADCKKINNAIDSADCGMVETIMEIYPKHFVYSVDKNDGSKGDWFGWNGNRWEKSDAPFRIAIMYEIERYWKSLMKRWDEIYDTNDFKDVANQDQNYLLWSDTKKKMNERIRDLKTSHGVQSVVSIAKSLMADSLLEFDTKQNLFGCENGVIDIENECFRKYSFDDYITWSCGYDFHPVLVEDGFKIQIGEEETMVNDKIVKILKYREFKFDEITENDKSAIKNLEEIYTKIFPDEELRNYFFKIISTGMTGKAIEKVFVFNGSGRNGKGFTNEFLQVVLGDYFTTVSPIVFCEDPKKKTSSGSNPEIANLDKKRYVVSKEPPKDIPFQNSVMKDYTGGGDTKARMNYSNKTSVKLCMTLVIECNNKPPFAEQPGDAEAERIDDILFGSKFTANESEWDSNTGEVNHVYPGNPNYKNTEWQKQHRNVMLNILLRNIIIVKRQNYSIDYFRPESVKIRSLAYLQDSFDIHNVFINLFEKRVEEKANLYQDWKGLLSDNDWSLVKIIKKIRESHEFFELLKDKKKRKQYTAEYIETFFRKNAIYKSSIIMDSKKHTYKMVGWRLKPLIKEQDEEEEEEGGGEEEEKLVGWLLWQIKINGVNFGVENENDGSIYSLGFDGYADVFDEVGRYVEGVPTFYKKEEEIKKEIH